MRKLNTINRKRLYFLTTMVSLIAVGCHNNPEIISGWPTDPVSVGVPFTVYYEIPSETANNAYVEGSFDNGSAGQIDCANTAGTNNPVEGQCTVVVLESGTQDVTFQTVVVNGHSGSKTYSLEGAGGGTLTNNRLSSLIETTVEIIEVDPATSVGQGGTATFTVMVSSSDNTTPLGDVTISGGGGECTEGLSLNRPVQGSGGTITSSSLSSFTQTWMSCSYELTTLGSVTITATYSGDSQHWGSETTLDYQVESSTLTGSGLGLLPAPTIEFTSLDPATSVGQGGTVAFNVHVSPGDANILAATGGVKISGGGGECTATLDLRSNGTCSYEMTDLGNVTITAEYEGDGLNGPASATLDYLVESSTITGSGLGGLNPTTTTITRVVSPNLSVKGQAATFYVEVTAEAGTLPSGRVMISGAGGSCTVTLSLSGQGNCAYQMSVVGQHAITATYEGDTSHLGSESSISYGVIEPTPEPPKDEGCNDPNDSDCDGVNNFTDECPGTAKGVSVGETGCP